MNSSTFKLKGAWGWMVAGLVLLAAVIGISPGKGMGQARASFRIAFSSSMFSDVNENDAKAAVKVWSQTVAKERGIEVDPETRVFKDMPSLTLALQSDQVDAVGINAVEYEALSAKMKLAPVFVTRVGGLLEEDYVLLVHRDSKIQGIGELRGRSLNVYQNVRACLALVWLDTLLVQKGFRPAAEFFGRVTETISPSKVVLPVFFRQSDACLVTRSGFELMTELNPQTGKQLKILASSPKVVPAIFCFRAGYSSPFKDQLLARMRDLHTTPAGQQVLTIFRSEKLEEHPASILQNALELLAEHRRLCAPPGRGRVKPPEWSEQPGPGSAAPDLQRRRNP